MEENPENYNELINRLKSGDRSTFRNDLELLAQTFGSFRPLEEVAKLSAENKELLRVVLELIKEHGQTGHVGLLSFHSTREVGPEAIPYIREEWNRNLDAKGIHYLHMCLVDIIGATSRKEEWQRLMPILAGQEIPLWIDMLQSRETITSRGLIAWATGALAKHAPAQAKQAGELIISLLYDDDSRDQIYAVRGLLSIGDKGMLQDALFRLARVARDESALELLLSAARENIDVNAKDAWGKTALVYAEEMGNKRMAEILENAGANR